MVESDVRSVRDGVLERSELFVRRESQHDHRSGQVQLADHHLHSGRVVRTLGSTVHSRMRTYADSALLSSVKYLLFFENHFLVKKNNDMLLDIRMRTPVTVFRIKALAFRLCITCSQFHFFS